MKLQLLEEPFISSRQGCLVSINDMLNRTFLEPDDPHLEKVGISVDASPLLTTR